jgi:hypothetical protein
MHVPGKALWICGLGGGRYRTRTYDLVRVKQFQSKTGVDWSGISQEFWTSRDCRGPLQFPKPPSDRHQN